MNNVINLVLVTAMACGSASAVTSFNFNFAALGSNSNISSASAFSTNNGVGVTLSAFYATTTSSVLSGATAANYSGNGLGICNPITESSCGSPEHQIDNNGVLEFMLFQFSTPVDIGSITVANFGGNNDRDVTYYTGTSGLTGASTLTNLGNAWTSAMSIPCGACTGSSSTYALSGKGISYLLVGAGNTTGDGNDYFKIQSLSSAPEPSTVQSGLLALVGIGFWARRRTIRKA